MAMDMAATEDQEKPGEAHAAEAAASAETIEFTPREQAIMAGEDPDRAGESAELKSEPGTEALSTGGGTEAASEQSSENPQAAAGREAGKPWYSDEQRDLAGSYGMSEDDLKGFSGEDEFLRTASLLDRQLAGAALRRIQAQQGQAQQGQAVTDPAGAAGQPPAKPAEGNANPPAAEADDLDPQKYIDAGYDDHTVNLVKQLKAQRDRSKAADAKLDQVSKEFAEYRTTLQRQVETQRHQERLRLFHDAADKLNGNLFGRSLDDQGRVLKLADASNDNRRKLFEATNILVMGIEESAKQAGVQPQFPPYELLVRRAEQMVFADELRRDREERTRAQLAEQSKRRRPVAAQRKLAGSPAAAGESTSSDEARRLASLPALKELWNEMSEDAGKAA